MGPITTGLGEIYMYLVKAEPGAKDEKGEPYTPMSLRTLQDWVIKPQLRTVPGVVEVNTIGGYEKQYHVAPRPEKLIAYNLSFRDIMTALASNNANVGAGYIERNGEQYLIRAPGQVLTLEDIGLITVGTFDGVPVHLHDVAEIGIGSELRTGAATAEGQGGRARHRLHARGRKQPHRFPARRATRRGGEQDAPQRRRRAHRLQPHRSGQRHDQDGEDKSLRRRGPRHRRSSASARERPRAPF